MAMRQSRMESLMVVVLICAGGIAQAAERLNATYTYLQPSDGDLKDEVEQHEVKAGGLVTLKRIGLDGYGLTVGVAAQANVWEFDDSRIDDLDLYKVKVPITGTFMATERIPVSVSVVPGIHSDFEDVGSDDFRVEGSAVGSYLYSDTLQFVLGVGFGEDFGDPTAYPIGGVSWKATEALQVDLLFPAPKISYALTQDFRMYVAGAPAGGQWNVGDNDEKQIDVQQEGYRVGLGAEYQVVDGGWLYVAAGREGGRKMSIAVDDEKVLEDYDIEDATFVQIGFRLL